MNKDKLIKIVKHRYFRITFVLILIFYISVSFVTEWRTNAYIQRNQTQNEQNYRYMIENASRLTECFVENPNQDYCFTILGIISSQIDNADFNTSGVSSIWLNTYLYIASINIKNDFFQQERLIKISCNERILTKCERFIPVNDKKLISFQQSLRAAYRTQINLELSKFKNDDK